MIRVRHSGSHNTLQVSNSSLRHVIEVGGALAHVAAHADEQIAELDERLVHRAFRGLAGVDACVDVILQGRVLGHESLSVENVLGRSARLLATQPDVLCRGRESADCAHLLGVRGDGARDIRRLRERIGHPDDRADREAAADPDALECCGCGHASKSVVSSSTSESSTASALSPSALSVT